MTIKTYLVRSVVAVDGFNNYFDKGCLFKVIWFGLFVKPETFEFEKLFMHESLSYF